MIPCSKCKCILEKDWTICPKCGTKTKEQNRFYYEHSSKRNDFLSNVTNSNATSDKRVVKEITAPIVEFTNQEISELKAHHEFFEKLDDDQKKTVLLQDKRILCIAGAGSGKTTVLTKRIEYLIKHRGVDSKNILAITFTRRAAHEMKTRLKNIVDNSTITTFNSFCESNLIEHEHLYYNMPQRVISYIEARKLLFDCFRECNLSIYDFMIQYFDVKNIEREYEDEYISDLFNDILSIVDYLKNENLLPDSLLTNSKLQHDYEHRTIIEMFYVIISKYINKMKYLGLRDYSDQVLHFYNLISLNESLKKQLQRRYKYIFIDEYQDVNTIQVKLIDELLCDDTHLFVVGDPRQSIFGFRGSNIDYIVNFSKRYRNSNTVILSTNYRSAKNIVALANESIKEMSIVSQHSDKKESDKLFLIECVDEEKESEFVASYIKRIISDKTNKDNQIDPKEIFILARTNAQLDLIEKYVKEKEIAYIKRSVEKMEMSFAKSGEITISTIHAIKGLEAKVVFVIGLVSGLFPSKAKDKQILSIMKENYNSESLDEETRLFYVALTRAKEQLYLTYYSSKNSKKKQKSSFLTKEVIKFLKQDSY
jgi:superfamily I DNA/RNA helicase